MEGGMHVERIYDVEQDSRDTVISDVISLVENDFPKQVFYSGSKIEVTMQHYGDRWRNSTYYSVVYIVPADVTAEEKETI